MTGTPSTYKAISRKLGNEQIQTDGQTTLARNHSYSVANIPNYIPAVITLMSTTIHCQHLCRYTCARGEKTLRPVSKMFSSIQLSVTCTVFLSANLIVVVMQHGLFCCRCVPLTDLITDATASQQTATENKNVTLHVTFTA